MKHKKIKTVRFSLFDISRIIGETFVVDVIPSPFGGDNLSGRANLEGFELNDDLQVDEVHCRLRQGEFWFAAERVPDAQRVFDEILDKYLKAADDHYGHYSPRKLAILCLAGKADYLISVEAFRRLTEEQDRD